MPPREGNNSTPSKGSGVVSYRLAKRSICQINLISRNFPSQHASLYAYVLFDTILNSPSKE
ncbi:MAG: hypothetical protein LBC74_10255 [Planctomycetaceae bacterium]|nr:hypothetical protein [Planctomycetaceae bacterium]